MIDYDYNAVVLGDKGDAVIDSGLIDDAVVVDDVGDFVGHADDEGEVVLPPPGD